MTQQNLFSFAREQVNARDYGLPHDAFRPAQWDAICEIEEIPEKSSSNGNGNGSEHFAIIEAPTGVGKSGIATALGKDQNVTVLVATLNLLDQYERYGFKIVKGRANYPCALQSKISEWARQGNTRVPTAADCHYSPMDGCPAAHKCGYIEARQDAIHACRAAFTYPYAMLSHSAQNRGGILVCDEAHGVPAAITSFAEFSIGEIKRKSYGFDPFPFANYGPDGKGDLITGASKHLLYEWINSSISILKGIVSYHGEETEEGSRALQYNTRLDRLFKDISAGDWFLECRAGLVRERVSKGRYANSPGMKLRALDAKTVAPVLWRSKSKVVLMSATIGDPEPLMGELGVPDGYFYKSYPHPVPTEFRPIYDLHMERMTHYNISKNPLMYEIQARLIANWIREETEPHWRGIILTSSYYKITKLYENLMNMRGFMGGTHRIIHQVSGVRIDRLAQQFISDVKPGDILIASIQGFGHGIDLRGDLARYSVIAGVPHVNPTDRYEILRKKRPGGGKFAWWEAYNAIPQGLGRVARGETDENGNYIVNKGALADGSATTPLAMRNYSDWIKEAIK